MQVAVAVDKIAEAIWGPAATGVRTVRAHYYETLTVQDLNFRRGGFDALHAHVFGVSGRDRYSEE